MQEVFEMSLLVVGSIALDTIKTPFGKVKEALGGSATYFSMAAQHLTDINLVAVVGKDFSKNHCILTYYWVLLGAFLLI